MKTKNIITFIIVCGLGIIFFSCTSPEPTASSEIYYAKDVTASAESNHSLDLNAEKIISFLGLDDRPMSSARYSHSLLTELSLNQEFSTELEAITLAKFNPYRRKAQIKKFTSTIQTSLEDLASAKYDRPSSNIFVTLSDFINKVAKNGADRQVIIIQSDMLNHSRIFSAYNKKQLEKVEKTPDFLVGLLEQHAKIIHSLEKMKIIIVFQPSNTQTDFAFRIIAKQYIQYLESKNIQSVEIRSEFINNNQAVF